MLSCEIEMTRDVKLINEANAKFVNMSTKELQEVELYFKHTLYEYISLTVRIII